MRDSSRRELREAAWLALVPMGVALVLGLLLLPRRAAPESVPLPVPDEAALFEVARSDHRLAEEARREPLPGPVRALGSAIREFHSLEARGAQGASFGQARRAVDLALIDALSSGSDALLRLRAVELEEFLAEVERWATTGNASPELGTLAGGFAQSMRAEGWWDGRTLVPGKPVLRVMFKHMWNTFLGVEGGEPAAPGVPRRGLHVDGLGPTLDEERVLYAFYLSHPRVSRGSREALAAARRGARDDQDCRAIVGADRAARESWRLERIGQLAAVDPAYPADYARGIARFRRGEYAASADAFRTWLGDHPEGPLALRARTYLRTAVDAARVQ